MTTPGNSLALTRSSRRRRITDDQADEIVRLRLQGLSVRDTAARVGVNKQTVQAEYNAYRREVAAELSAAELAELRAEAVTRHERAMAAAWEAWIATGKPEYLTAHQRSAAQLDEVTGVKAAARVEHSGPHGGPIEVDVGGLSDDELRRLAGEG